MFLHIFILYIIIPSATALLDIFNREESITLIFIITVMLPVQCGGRKTSPSSQSMLFLFLILDVAVRVIYSHARGLHGNVISSPKSSKQHHQSIPYLNVDCNRAI